eukprot:Em0020g914a
MAQHLDVPSSSPAPADLQSAALPRQEEMSIKTRTMTLKKRIIKLVSKRKKGLPNLSLSNSKRPRSKTVRKILDTELLGEDQQTGAPQLNEPSPQDPLPAPTKVTWLDIPLDHDQLSSVLRPLLRRMTAASSLFTDARYTAMQEYLTKVAEHLGVAVLQEQEEEKILWKLTCKVTGVEHQSTKVKQEANLYCRFGVLWKTTWDAMQQQDLNSAQQQDSIRFSALLSQNETVEFLLGDLEHNILGIEVWGSNKKRSSSINGRHLSIGSNDPTQSIQSIQSLIDDSRPLMAPLFIGRASCTFQDILLGTTERELVLFSHTKRHERGKVSIQLSIAVPQSNASIQETLVGYEALFKAIVRHESQIEGNGCPVRMWSAQLPPLARDLLHAHATWHHADVLQTSVVELGLLVDYHRRYGVKMVAFMSLLDQVKEAMVNTDGEQAQMVTPAGSKEKTSCKTSGFDSAQSTTSSPQSDPASPSSAASEVMSPFSGEPLPLSITSARRSRQISESSQAIIKEEEMARKHDPYLSQVFKELACCIEDNLRQHLSVFDITKPEEIEECLKVLQTLHTLHPFVEQLSSKINFQTTIEDCIKNGVQNWFSVCNTELRPGRQYKATSLKALSEACCAKCREVKEHIVDIFKRFHVDYLSIFIQVIGTRLTELSSQCIAKEKSLPLDRNTAIAYYQAYLTCRQIETCAGANDEPSALKELNIWRCYEHLVGSWVELASVMCRERMRKAIAVDEVVREMDQVMYSTSVVDANMFLHQMVSFWKSLDWPNAEQAFGYGLKHFENLGQCVLDYIETCYQQLSEKYLHDSEGRISISERICVFFNNVDQIKKQVPVVTQKMEIRRVGQLSADRSLEVLAVNMEQIIEQKIQSFMEQICEKLKPEISQCISQERPIEALQEFLGSNLQILNENLIENIYKEILHTVWKVTIQAIEGAMIDNKYDENVLHRTLMSLKEFFSEALSKEELETPYYKAFLNTLQNRLLSTQSLIAKCCAVLAGQQELAKTSNTTRGEVFISVGYTTDMTVELNVIKAKVNTTHKDGSSDIFVYIWILPQLTFTECAKKKYKTDLVKGTLEPNFCKEFIMPANKDCLKMEGSILALGVYYTKSKYLAGLCVLPCSEIPILGERGSIRSKITLPLFTIQELKGGPMGELAVRHSSQDADATKFYRYLTKKLHIWPQP